MTIDLICLDADDTLWHNEWHFEKARNAFCALMLDVALADITAERLETIGRANLAIYGFGAKSFALSMVEAAEDLYPDALPKAVLKQLLAIARGVVNQEVELLPGVEAALHSLRSHCRIVMVTKGELHHQEIKIAASGLGDLFSGIEIVSDKTPATYARVFERYGAPAEHALMAGDSMKSDILPALAVGAWGVHIPASVVWSHERAEAPLDHPRFRTLTSLEELPALVAAIDGRLR